LRTQTNSLRYKISPRQFIHTSDGQANDVEVIALNLCDEQCCPALDCVRASLAQRLTSADVPLYLFFRHGPEQDAGDFVIDNAMFFLAGTNQRHALSIPRAICRARG
jgi:hypothetical protein